MPCFSKSLFTTSAYLIVHFVYSEGVPQPQRSIASHREDLEVAFWAARQVIGLLGQVTRLLGQVIGLLVLAAASAYAIVALYNGDLTLTDLPVRLFWF